MKFIIYVCLFILISCNNNNTTFTEEKITVSKTSFEIDGNIDNSLISIDVVTNTEWFIDDDNTTWITFDKVKGSGNSELQINVSKNPLNVERKTLFFIRSEYDSSNFCEIEIVQTANDENNVLNQIEDSNFKEFLIQNVFNGNTVISQEEANKIVEIDCKFSNIKSLKGIEIFPYLSVIDCSFNKIEIVDLSQNLELKEFCCAFNKIEIVDLSQNLELKEFCCAFNWIKEINLTNNKKLEDLDCGGNELETLNVKNNKELTTLDCSLNNLTHLDIRINSKITRLYCYANLFEEQSILINESFKKQLKVVSPPIESLIYNWQ